MISVHWDIERCNNKQLELQLWVGVRSMYREWTVGLHNDGVGRVEEMTVFQSPAAAWLFYVPAVPFH